MNHIHRKDSIPMIEKKLWKGGQGTLMVLGNTPGVTQALTSVLKQK